jgi:hypothetical protein
MTEDASGDRQEEPLGLVQYVVLFHSGVPQPHFDVMFESSEVDGLITFRAQDWPVKDEATWEQIGLHRRDYLDFQGKLSRDRGEVRRVAFGRCTVDPPDGLTRGRAIIRLDGEILSMKKSTETKWDVYRSIQRSGL